MNAVHIRACLSVEWPDKVKTLCGLDRPYENTVMAPENAEAFIRGNSELCIYCGQSALTGIPRRHPKAEEV